jgi:two-component system cell cycle response regulator
MDPHLVILIDPDERRDVVARRLRSQGFQVDVYADPIEGANAALASPPHVVVADLWMPGISGVQLTRLLTSEPATMGVPIVLRAVHDEPRSRFWSRHAGAAGYVAKGRMGELVRTLKRVLPKHRDAFFMHLGQPTDVRDRISAHLDRALFESVLASEIRALGSAGSFDRLLDLFSQLLVQITSYRWMVIANQTGRIGLHCRPELREVALAEAWAALGREGAPTDVVTVEDDDADAGTSSREMLCSPIWFNQLQCGTFMLAPSDRSDADQGLAELVGRELGSALRMVMLVEETQRLAVTDTLTGLLRRAPFIEKIGESFGRVPLAVLLLDLDRFKQINDQHGHTTGDRVLQAAGKTLSTFCRGSTSACRWGGEEFVLALIGQEATDAYLVAERVRAAIEAVEVTVRGVTVPVTASIGVALWRPGDTIDALLDRADLAMYAAKTSGRNRVMAEAMQLDLSEHA